HLLSRPPQRQHPVTLSPRSCPQTPSSSRRRFWCRATPAWCSSARLCGESLQATPRWTAERCSGCGFQKRKARIPTCELPLQSLVRRLSDLEPAPPPSGQAGPGHARRPRLYPRTEESLLRAQRKRPESLLLPPLLRRKSIPFWPLSGKKPGRSEDRRVVRLL